MARMLFICIIYASVLKCVAMAISTSSPPVAPGMSRPQSLSANHSQINTNAMDSSLLKYLRKFKYLDPSPCTSCDQDSSIIAEALSTLQQWAQINNTGILDSDTVEVMSKRRCGVPDEPKQFSVSSMKSKRHKRGFFWQIYHGSRWYKNDLTYIINMPHKFPNKRAVEKIISAALHVPRKGINIRALCVNQVFPIHDPNRRNNTATVAWESVTKLTFTQKRYGYADIEVNFLTGRHGDGSPFDGNGGILAHAFFPYDNSPGLSGDAHFDADEDWGSEMDMNTTADLYCVAVHEFGHSLGLMHSRWPISIMWPWMKGDCTLSKFDIAVIQKIYGSASERKWKRPRPTAYSPKTTPPFIKPYRPPSSTTSSSSTTTTIISTPFSSSSSSSPSLPSSASTIPIQTGTMSNASTVTSNIKTTTSTVGTNITNAYTSSVGANNSTTITLVDGSLEISKTSPATTNFVSLFQPSTTMADFVLAQEDVFRAQKTTASNLPPTTVQNLSPTNLPPTEVENSPTSSMIYYPDTLPSKNQLSTHNSLVFKTPSSSNGVYEEKTFRVSEKRGGSSPPNQPTGHNDLSDRSNTTPDVLPSQTQPFSTSISPLKSSSSESTSSNLQGKTFWVSEKRGGSSPPNQPTGHNDLSDRSNNTPDVLPSQTQPFSTSISPLKSSSSESTSSNLQGKTFWVSEKRGGSSPPNQPTGRNDSSDRSNTTPDVLPSQTQPFSTSISPLKSSSSESTSSNLQGKTFWVSEKSGGSSPPNQPTGHNDLSDRSNNTPDVLPSQTQPFSTSISPLKSSSSESTSSNLQGKTFWVSEKRGGSSPPNQPTGHNDLSDRSNTTPDVLPLQTQPFFTSISPLKSSSPESTSSNLNGLPSTNSLFMSDNFSSQTEPPYPNDLTSEPQVFDINIFTSITKLRSRNYLTSQNPLSESNDILFKISQSDQKSSPFLSTLFVTDISPSDLYSLSSANHFHTYQDHPKDPYYLNEVDEMYINTFSRLPKVTSSSWNQRHYLETSKQPNYQSNSPWHASQYKKMPDPAAAAAAAGGGGGRRGDGVKHVSKRKNSKLTSSAETQRKGAPPSKANEEKLIRVFPSVTNQPKFDFRVTSPQIWDTQASPQTRDSVFSPHRFPEKNPLSSTGTQLYKTATVSMTTKPVVPSNELEWMLTSAPQVTVPEPALRRKTSPEITASFQPQHESGLQKTSPEITASFQPQHESGLQKTSPEITASFQPQHESGLQKTSPEITASFQPQHESGLQKTSPEITASFQPQHESGLQKTSPEITASFQPQHESGLQKTSPEITASFQPQHEPGLQKTSPEITASFQPQHEHGLLTDSYFDTTGFTGVLFVDQESSNPGIQKRTLPIPTEQENWKDFRLKLKTIKTDDKNGVKTISNLIDKKELYDRLYQVETTSKLPYILKASTNGDSQKDHFQNSYINTYNKLETIASKYTKINRNPQAQAQASQSPTSDQTKRTTSILRVHPIPSEAVPDFGKALRQQNQEREVYSPSSLQESIMSTFTKNTPTRDAPFVDLSDTSISPSAALFAGGAEGRRTHPLMRMVGGKKRVKMFKPRFRQKMSIQQFIQTLLYSTMHMMPAHGPPLRDTKFDPLTTPSLDQNADNVMRTLSAPPTNRILSRIATSSLKAEPYLIPRAISHRFLSSQTSPTTQKWTGDTQRNLPQISGFQARESAKNYLRESLRISSPDQQTTPLLLTIQNPIRQQSMYKDNRSLNSQASSLLPFRPKPAVSDREDVQTTPETTFHGIVTPHQRERQQMAPLSIYARRLKDIQEETGSPSRINKRSLDEVATSEQTTPSENWTLNYPPTLATSPSLVFPSTLYSRQVDILNVSPGGDDTIKSVPQGYVHYSERGVNTTRKTTTMTITDPRRLRGIQPWCSGFVQIDGATLDGNGTISIFSGSGVMRFSFSGKSSERKRGREFIPISRIFPNGPNNVTAAASINLGKEKKWERTYLFQGHLVWRYRKCRRRYCLDRGYPTNVSQEFNVSTPIDVTAAYMNNRRRTLFLFNGTSSYHVVRCRWLRKSGCSSTVTEMQPGLLSSLRGIDAMFTHQGSFYVVHDGSYFTTMLRSMRNNVYQHGSIAQSWYGCPQNIP